MPLDSARAGDVRYSYAVRFRSLVPIVILSVVAVLALAVWGLRGERRRLLDGFAASQQEVATSLGDDLVRELEELDGDAQLVTTLVEGARNRAAADVHDERAVVRSGFDALATVVRHYRGIYLQGRGQSVIGAVDPSEPPDSGAAFGSWARTAAEHLTSSEPSVIEGPREGSDGRQFFVYGRRIASGEAVVLISEARFLLQPVLRSRGQLVQYFLVDPSRSLWLGCAQPKTCRAFTAHEWPSVPGLDALMRATGGGEGRAWTSSEVPRALGLPARAAVVGWKTMNRSGRTWIAGVVASAQVIEARERSLLRRLIATSLALVVAIGAVAALMVVHGRRSAALAERLHHAQEVAQLRERTERVFDTVSAGLVGITRDGRVALANRFFTERIAAVPAGMPLAEVLGSGDAAATAHLERAIGEVIASGRPRVVSDGEVRLLVGSERHYDLRLIPLDQPATELAALLIVQDISEVKTLEKQLVRAEKLVTVGVLTAGLAHEIGTPLGIIRGRAEVLQSKVNDPALARDLDSVIQQIDHIGQTIRRVLDFSHAQPVELRSVSPREAIDGALALLDFRLRAKDLTVKVDASSDLPPLAADPDQLRQVLVNLLLNACDACRQKGNIGVRGRRAGDDAVVLEISDDGCGIAAEYLNAVFDPYFTTKKRGEGTGLGLPVAASIVGNHQGEIRLWSGRGGTTVEIRWPVARERAKVAHG